MELVPKKAQDINNLAFYNGIEKGKVLIREIK
jgi:hypothetical protein